MSNSDYTMLKNSLLFHNAMGGLWTDNSDETYIVLSPDSWEWNGGQKAYIKEPHLKDYLGIRRIVFPPGAKDRNVHGQDGKITLARFPLWHRCKGWRTKPDGKKEPCGAMRRLSPDSKLPLCSIPTCSGSQSHRTSRGSRATSSTFAPVRFMLACSEGHLDEFPFHWWVHQDEDHNDHELRYLTRNRAGLQGIVIQCVTCSSELDKKEKSMSGILSPETFSGKLDCKGARPWLKTNCDCRNDDDLVLVGVQKSSSNLLFPVIRNAIFCPDELLVPPWLNDLLQDPASDPTKLQMIANMLNIMPVDVGQALGMIFQGHDRLEEMTQYLPGIQQLLNGDAENTDPFKGNGYAGILQREFNRFLLYPEENRSDDFTVSRPVMTEYGELVRSAIESVVLIEKLRDTRAYVGFTRILPWGEEEAGNVNELILKCYGSSQEVYGDVVRGEGVFLQFSSAEIQKWIAKPEVDSRIDLLDKSKFTEVMRSLNLSEFSEAKAFMLIHSVSHALISALSGLAGYNTASLKERIYVGPSGDGRQMYGLLIYTNSGDSEGSLGGLVRMGRPGRLDDLLKEAIEASKWCSSDPLCRRSVPKGAGGGILASCHHCIMLPETTCQCRNDLLDRELVISLDHPNLGFFTD